MTSKQHPSSIPLREVLVCEVIYEDQIIAAVVMREGMKFQLVGYLLDDQAALVRDSRTLNVLEKGFELPVRVLEGDEGAFLGVQTARARREGRDFYHLKVEKPSLL